MREHELKVWRGPFAALWDGRKTFEFRKDDRGYSVGDVLCLREWDEITGVFTGRAVRKHVPHLLRDGFGLPEGYVVMSLGPV